VGNYVAEFVGVEKCDPIPGTDYGPGFEWTFVVAEGECKGQATHRITGREPTARNSCGRLLSGLAGAPLGRGQEVDVAQFVGKAYRIVVEPNQNGTGTRVVDYKVEPVLPGVGGQGTAPAAPPPAAPRYVGPAVPPQGAPSAPPRPSYWVEAEPGKPATKMTLEELQAFVDASEHRPENVHVCKVGTDNWQSAKDVGIREQPPF